MNKLLRPHFAELAFHRRHFFNILWACEMREGHLFLFFDFADFQPAPEIRLVRILPCSAGFSLSSLPSP